MRLGSGEIGKTGQVYIICFPLRFVFDDDDTVCARERQRQRERKE